MKVLEVLADLDGGGIERFLYDCCCRIVPEIQIDFAVVSNREGILEEPLIALGCKIYHLPKRHEDLRKYMKELSKIIISGGYDIVHDHGGYKAAISLYCAWRCGVKRRIAHAHGAYITLSSKEKMERTIFTPITKHLATDLLACGEDAAKWMWGGVKGTPSKHIMYYGIETEHFFFSQQVRDKIRTELGLQGKTVFGNVARLSYQKNHEFLLRVFREIADRNKNAVLLLIGRGELEASVRTQVKELQLEKAVRFLGVRKDVSQLLNAMDCFLLSSRYEGFPVALIEAQANGLPIFCADSVTTEVKLLKTFEFLSLAESPELWAEKICACRFERCEGRDAVSRYDIKNVANELKEFYLRI